MLRLNKYIAVVIILLLIISGACFILLRPIKSRNINNIVNINITEYKNKIEQKEDFILFVSAKTCKYCSDFEPILDIALEQEGVLAFEIQSDKNEEYLYLVKEELGERYQGTPAIYFYLEGEIEEYFIGTQDKSIIKKYIERYKDTKVKNHSRKH